MAFGATVVPAQAPPATPAEPVQALPLKIDVSHVNFYYGSHRVLDDISLAMHANQVTAFIGPSGCG